MITASIFDSSEIQYAQQCNKNCTQRTQIITLEKKSGKKYPSSTLKKDHPEIK